MKVLVDSSVWLRFFANRAPFGAELQRLLFDGQVIGHALVFGELLIGDIGGRKLLLARYEQLPYADPIPHEQTVNFVRHHRLHGRGIGWIDAHLLASALAGRLSFWTADQRVAALAAQLGIAYQLR